MSFLIFPDICMQVQTMSLLQTLKAIFFGCWSVLLLLLKARCFSTSFRLLISKANSFNKREEISDMKLEKLFFSYSKLLSPPRESSYSIYTYANGYFWERTCRIQFHWIHCDCRNTQAFEATAWLMFVFYWLPKKVGNGCLWIPTPFRLKSANYHLYLKSFA